MHIMFRAGLLILLFFFLFHIFGRAQGRYRRVYPSIFCLTSSVRWSRCKVQLQEGW